MNAPQRKLIQYIITQSKGEEFKNEALNIYFKGTFAVITLDENEMLQNIYIGEGESLKYKNRLLQRIIIRFYKEY